MRSRRALLYMPAHEMRKIEKAAGLGVDCVCMDLEDSVPAGEKAKARKTAAEALRTLDFGTSERLVRINPVGSPYALDDLRAVLAARPDGIVIPKLSDAESLQWVSSKAAEYEAKHGWVLGGIRLIVIIESARAILNLPAICSADSRLEALIFGAEDLAADMGAIRTPVGTEILYARSAVVLHAAAFNLQALDMVHVNFRDPEATYREALAGAEMGFTGKQVIHPAQVEPVQRAFTPDDETIRKAQALLDAYEQHAGQGRGAFATAAGDMVDAPVIKMAQNVLARARAAGKVP